ncbi:MAG: dihydrolipoamide dehydrogenase [Solirubrobacterales bacterium]|jgi:dihydrolipoamide dehydrogenase|nr:dihydrolipoamide dehydrogenase [Solirubrobacterales bacterium]
MPDSFDQIIIGGGPGGYVAAIRAAQLGQKTAVVERDKPGGRCLNYACIPAKTLLRTAEIYTEARDGAEIGIVAKDVALDWDALGKRRAAVSDSLSKGVSFLWDKNKVTSIAGEGSLTADGGVRVGEEVYEAGAVILATGSAALPIPGVEFGDRVVDTWGTWSLPEQPGKIAVVGAGASGAEIASAYARFGTEVILIEMLDQILPAEDKDIAKIVERVLKKQGIEVSTGTPVENVEAGKKSVKFTYGDKSAEVDYLCIAGGRRPDVDGLGLKEAGVELEENGKVKVDPYGQTTNPKVFAIGDLVNKKALAHKAEEEGVVAVEKAAGVETHPVDQNLMVGATFCHPQVASVGLTEAAAKEAGHEVKVGKQKISGEGAGTVYDDKDGIVKLVVDAKYGEVLGAHIVGNRACDMIAELVATMALEGGYQELSRIVHPHPTVSEAVLDAARAVDGWAIHA